MPPSLLLQAFGLLSALAIAALAVWHSAAWPAPDPYAVTVKLAAGIFVAAGSLCLARAIGITFLGNGGRRAFKALYWASFAAAGAGIAEAASGFVAADVPLAAGLASLALAGAGILLLLYPGGG